MFSDLNQRSLEVFYHIVETFVETGAPVGSKALLQRLGMGVSSATIRNIMAHLEECGLLYAPHTSAGRVPTEGGLRFFVEGLLQVGTLSAEEEAGIRGQCTRQGRSLEDVLLKATETLSGLTSCAGLVLSPKIERALKHVEFVALAPGRALVVLVSEEGFVENRVIQIPEDAPPGALQEATNYMNAKLVGRSLEDAKEALLKGMTAQNSQLNEVSQRLIQEGVACWSGEGAARNLLVFGQSRLLENVRGQEELERVRLLLSALESKRHFLDILDAVIAAEGVQIFIGASNPLFDISGCSMILSPYQNQHGEVVGAVGVIGPMRMNYGRVIPIVDYTARVMSKLL